MDTSATPKPSPSGESISWEVSPDEQLPLRVLAGVADPIRLRILRLLQHPLSVGEICEHVRLAQPRVSHHLAVLREAELVTVQRKGRQRVYQMIAPVAPGPRRDLVQMLRKWFASTLAPVAVAGRPDRAPVAPSPSLHPSRRESDMEDYLL